MASALSRVLAHVEPGEILPLIEHCKGLSDLDEIGKHIRSFAMSALPPISENTPGKARAKKLTAKERATIA